MKDPEWYGIGKLGSDGAPSIFIARADNHPRIRKHLLPAFFEKALREQEISIQSYVELLVEKLEATASSDQPADMVKWYCTTSLPSILSVILQVENHSAVSKKANIILG